jgi:hypothetical protein
MLLRYVNGQKVHEFDMATDLIVGDIVSEMCVAALETAESAFSAQRYDL